MAYDGELADRLREALSGEAGIREQRMFGGLAFLLNGRLAVAVVSAGGLMVRVDPEDTDRLVAEPGATRFVMRGRELDGWLRIEADAVETDEALRRWVALGRDFARGLPAKS